MSRAGNRQKTSTTDRDDAAAHASTRSFIIPFPIAPTAQIPPRRKVRRPDGVPGVAE